MVRGTAKFDGVAVGEFSVSRLGPTTKMQAKAAFIGSQSGHTHAWTTNEQWSAETMQRLRELLAAMEIDLARIHFSDSDLTVATTNPWQSEQRGPGLGEFLSEGEGRSI